MVPRLRHLALLILIVGAIGSCTKDKPIEPQLPPQSPDLFTAVAWSDNTITLTWHDRSSEEDGFHLRIQVADSFVRTDTCAANTTLRVVSQLTPGTSYYFRLTAFNEGGESDSTTLTAQTTGNPPPLPPTNVQAVALNSHSVHVTWTRAGTPQNYLVSRRQDSGGWSTIATRPAADSSYTDSTVAPVNTYYYRVGAKTGNSTTWSADSAFVNTPDGPPLAPDSLHATVEVGGGVTLDWRDRSTNETGFHLGRSSSSQGFAVIDSVSANDTTYTDPVTDIDSYSYRVRAFNAQGVSEWSTPLEVRYDYCSDGIIPLCQGNWWLYDVSDTVGPDFFLHREILRLEYVNTLNFYLLGHWNPQELNPPTDTLEYLRNYAGSSNGGCYQLDYPLSGNPTPQQLFKYPATVGDEYSVNGTTMLVASTGTDLNINGHVYLNCYIYQWQLGGTHVMEIYVMPETVGIVREREIINTELVVQRDLFDYFVQNH